MSPPPPSTLTLRATFLAASLMSASMVGCGGSQEVTPGTAFAGSLAAQEEIRALEEAWELEGAFGRRKLRKRLESYLIKYPIDPSCTRVRLMLAQIALAEGRLDNAETQLRSVRRGPPGSARDEADVIYAAILSARGQHEEALRLLEPLQGKLLTHESRDQYARVRTQAAISARRWRLTVQAMTAWIVEAGPAAGPVKDWISASLVQIPETALAHLLADWPEVDSASLEVDSASPEGQASDYLHRLFIEYLTGRALESRDHQLARDLLEHSPPWLRASESGDALAVLASLAARDARVIGRSVGVVLGGETALERKHAMRLGAGLMRRFSTFAEKQSSSGKEASPIKLLVAEDRGSIASALGSLSGLGASVLIAGVTEESAEEAVAFSDAREMPVVVLSPPKKGAELGPFAFVFGTGVDEEQAGMRGAPLDQSAFRFVLDPADCEAEPGSKVTFPFTDWAREGVQAVGVLAESGCVQRLLEQRRSEDGDLAVVLGLLAGSASYAEENLYRLTVGKFPGPLSGSPEASDWFGALGTDLGTLVHAALTSLPETQVSEKGAVKERHLRTRDALLKARGDLVTSEQRGFSEARTMKRTFRVVRVPKEGLAK